MPSNHFIFCHPILLLPSVFASIRVFSKGSVLLIRWPTYWSFSFSINHSNEYSGLISFRTDRFDLLGVQGTLKSLLWHHSSKASILRCSAFFTVQLSHPYMTTGKTIALTIQSFVGKVMSLLLNMLSRLVITFLPREQVSFNFMAAVTICSDFGVQENEVCHHFHCFPIYFQWSDGTGFHEVMGLDAMILDFWMLSFKPEFSLSSVTFIKRLFSSSSLSAIRVVSSAYLRLLIFLLESWFDLVLQPAQHFAWCTLHIS